MTRAVPFRIAACASTYNNYAAKNGCPAGLVYKSGMGGGRLTHLGAGVVRVDHHAFIPQFILEGGQAQTD